MCMTMTELLKVAKTAKSKKSPGIEVPPEATIEHITKAQVAFRPEFGNWFAEVMLDGSFLTALGMGTTNVFRIRIKKESIPEWIEEMSALDVAY